MKTTFLGQLWAPILLAMLATACSDPGSILVGSAVVAYMIGRSNETTNQQKVAVRDAGELAKEITTATDTAKQLADLVKSIKDKLAAGKYPEEESKKLGGLRVPFEGANIGLRGIGRFNKDTNRGLVNFAGKSAKTNDLTEDVQRMLAGSKKTLADAFALKDKPKVLWSAIVGGGPAGPWATMVTIPEPFLAKSENSKWPDSMKMKVGGKETTVKRYAKGDPGGGEPQFIPVEPNSQNMVCPNINLARILRAIQDLEDSLRGIQEPGGHEEMGLIETGRILSEKLKQIGSH